MSSPLLFLPSATELFTIAEIGLNHNGCIKTAKELICLASEAGFSAVKFQLRSSKLFLGVGGHRDIGSEIVDAYIQSTFLTYDQYAELFHFAVDKGLNCFFSVWDFASLEFAETLHPTIYKVPSADLANYPLLYRLINTRAHLILSTGMSNQEDIEQTVEFLEDHNSHFSLLHCHSAYPSPIHHLNLSLIPSFKQKLHVPIGYSSHDIGAIASTCAVALGATIIEKHISLDKSHYGNDHVVSLEPNEFKPFIDSLHLAFSSLGTSESRRIGPGEKSNKISLGKSLVLVNPKDKGSSVQLSDVDFYPSGEGLSPSSWHQVANKPLLQTLQEGTLLQSHHFTGHSTSDSTALPPSVNIGIPVRYRDSIFLLNKFKPPYCEIHLTNNDLLVTQFPFKTLSPDQTFGFHAPDIYSENLIFDPFSEDSLLSSLSDSHFDRVLEHVTLFKKTYQIDYNIKLVTSFSSYTDTSHADRKGNYERIAHYIHSKEAAFPGITILPQLLPAFAWYLGGQRYVNTFADPYDVLSFSSDYNIKICLDTSHLIMACNHFSYSLSDCLHSLLPVTSHFHLAGAQGIDDEGLSIADSHELPSLLQRILPSLPLSTSLIVETWQGHLDQGSGFLSELRYLASLLS